MIPINLPKHENCKNCGVCCGTIPVMPYELQEIMSYLTQHPLVRHQAQQNSHQLFTCPFRDEANKKCIVYPVRPIICRMWGVCDRLDCPHGNTAHIDGRPYIQDHDWEKMIVINLLDWEEAE